jgi:large subunit ribosomal protein L22
VTGPKLNEKNFVAGDKGGTKASAMYIRSSASKARLVLNIIRDLPVKQADEVLQFTDKGIAVTVRKVLASAVANAQHNDAQDPEELYVKACFADEGPTLRRFAARARGRGTRINKRTCHITILVDRLDDTRLAVVQAKDANRTTAGRRRGAVSSTAARRERVARSRDRAQGLKAGDTDTDDAATDTSVTDNAATESDVNATVIDTELPDAPVTETETETDTATDIDDENTDAADEAPSDSDETDASEEETN